MKKLILIRRFSQVSFLALFIYILWSTTYPLKGILPPDAFFKIDPLVSMFISISERVVSPGIIFAIAMLFLTLILGRFFCGWVCPLGTVIDICGVKSKNRSIAFRQIKYYIFGIIVILSFLGIQISWIFDPMVIMARFVSLNFIPYITFLLDKTLAFIIKGLNFYEPLYDFYRMLKSNLLGVNIYYFSHSRVIFILFIFICGLGILTKRFWCRAVCPLGAFYSIIAKFAILRRNVEKCTKCFKCKDNCRMDAINKDLSYRKEECILCMDCIYDCPTKGTRFNFTTFSQKRRGNVEGDKGKDAISRKDFIFLILSSIFLLGFNIKGGDRRKTVLRPPGVLNESKFLNKCIRCGNCMKVCPTNGLQPIMFESGLTGIWTPQLVPEIGYCEYNCNLCGNVCPTGAIPKLSITEKQNQRLGIARIDRSVCIAWAKNAQCIVCEEQCPVPTKAIKLYREEISGNIILRPYVDIALCIGCGICQNKCPVRPIRAVRVLP